mgnify:CR=1 FL=1
MSCEQVGEVMGGMMGQMGPFGGSMMWGWGAWIAIIGLAVMVAIGVAIVVAIGRRQSPAPADDAHEILRRRFARGEITADEFDTARTRLS